MTTRNDVTVDFFSSPRVAIVDAPSTEFTAQDIVDTLRKHEDSLRGISEDKLLDASGKESLGGGVLVGITAALQNTQIAFEGRTTPAEIGTVTTASSPPVGGLIDLHDTNALFQTNNIARGSLVINFTDQSIAEVYDVIDEDHLRTKVLVNGISNTFDLADEYQVFNVAQCEVTGGNVVAVDELEQELSPILPTAFTQVVRTSSSSATISNQDTVNHAAFNRVVTLDQANGVPGTVDPTGTGFQPVDNIANAITILNDNGLHAIRVVGDLLIDAADNIDGIKFIGDGTNIATFTFSAGCSTESASFFDAELTGTLDGAIHASGCRLSSLSGIGSTLAESSIINCEFEASTTIGVNLTNSQKIHFSKCESGSAGTVAPPIIDFNGSTGNVTFHKYAGTAQLSDISSAVEVSFNTTGGALTVDSTCVLGTIVVSGDTKIDDQSGAGCTVTNSTTSNLVWDHQVNGALAGSFGEVVRHSAFGNYVHLDTNSGSAGTDWPLGTVSSPVNNMADAIAIGIAEGIRSIKVAEDVTIGATDVLDGFLILGAHASKADIIVTAGASTTFTEFRDCGISGTMSGQIVIRDSFVGDITNFEGVIYNCMLSGEITSTGATPSYILSCYSGNAGPPFPEINLNGAGQVLILRAYSGAIKLTNKTGPEIACMDFLSGKLILDGTVTNGAIVARGIYDLDDGSTGTTTLTQSTNLDDIEIKIDNIQTDVDVIEVTVSNTATVIDTLIKYQQNKSIIDPTAYTLTIYDDDGTTPLTVFDLKDSSGVASIISIFQRIPQ